jgi:hypothetical protein
MQKYLTTVDQLVVGACAIVGRHSILQDKFSKNIARLRIAEAEMSVRRRKEALARELAQLQHSQDRLNTAKRCLILGYGYP